MATCVDCAAEVPAPVAVGTFRCGKASLAVWGVQSPLAVGQRFGACVRVKSRDGLPLGDVRVVVIDDGGATMGTVRLAGEKAEGPEGVQNGGGLAAEGVVELVAPREAGPVSWRAVLVLDGAVAAVRPLPFSVTPAPVRPVRLQVVDDATGAPPEDASVYLYHRNLAKVRPLHTATGADGFADTAIAEGAPYNVRIECRGYREGVCNFDAGDAATMAQGVVRLVADVRDELDARIARRGPAGY